jgi:outer membrane protein assembly factor BamB
MSWKRVVTVGLGLLCLAAAARAGDWPQFRGPGGAGVSDEKQLPAEWSADKNVAWKADIPGVAWSSPVVWGDKVFVTTAVTDKQTKPKPFGGGPFGRGDNGDDPPPRGTRPGGGFGGGGFPGMGGGRPPNAVYRWQVYCLDREKGTVLWKQTAVEQKPAVGINPWNSYATETPVTDGDRVYAYFGMTGLYCYDFDGKLLWNKDLGAYRTNMGYGSGSSPTLDGDRLFVQCDNEEKSFLVALNKKTGEELWRVKRDERSSWSTPFVWKNKKRTELVVCAPGRVRSYNTEDGKQLWELTLGNTGFGATSTSTPVADDERIYVGSGGTRGSGPLFAVKAGASGDVTPKDDKETDGVAWSRTNGGPGIASPLLYDGYLYVLERGAITCYEAATGQPAYRHERLRRAAGFTSSPWAGDGKVYCLDEEGRTFVIQAGPEFKLLGTNTIEEMCYATPAASGGALFLRGEDHLFCIKP